MLRIRSRRVAREVRSSVRFVCQSLESRTLLANVVWDGGPTGNGTDFLAAVNWVGDALPLAADTATVGATGTSPTITISGTPAVQTVNTSRIIQLTGGTISGGTWTLSSGATLNGSSSGGTLSSVALSGGDLLLNTTSANVLLAGNTSFPAARLTANAVNLQMAPGYVLNSLVSVEGATAGTRTITMAAGGTGTATIGASGVIRLASGSGGGLTMQNSSPATLVNNGLITAEASGQTLTIQNSTLTNNATLQVTAGTMTISPTTITNFAGVTLTSGTWRAASGGTLRLNGVNVATNAATIVLDGATSNIYNASSGTTSAVSGLTTNAIGGTFTLAGGRDIGVTPSGGTFSNNGGTINLGAGSTLSVTGAFTQPGSTLHVDIAGPVAATDFGQVTSTGVATLNGALTATLIGGYDPGFAVSFPVVVGASRSGTFNSFSGGPTASNRLLRDRYNATTAFVSVRPLAGSVGDLAAPSDSGVSPTDDITNDNTPTFTGTATDNATARIFSDGILVGSAAVSGGNWSVTTSVLSDGPHVITATIIDADGDESPVSGGPTVTIDTIAPAQPAIIDLQAGSDSGVSATDNITNDNTPTFDVTSTDAFYRLLQNAVQVSSDYATAATFTAGALPDAAHSFVLRAVDAAGNVSGDSATLGVTIDTVAPAVPVAPDLQAGSDSGVSQTDNITNDATPTFDLSASPFFRFERGGSQISNDYETGSSYTTPVQSDATFAFGVRAVDTAGNTSASSATLNVTVDTVAPAIPGAADLQAGSDSGVLQTDNITSDNTPTLDVTSTDTYFRFERGGTQISADYETGPSYTPAAQADGTFSFAIRGVDAAGNVSGAGGGLSVTIDTAAPANPNAPDLQAASDSGVSTTDNITNDNTPTFDLVSTDAYFRFERGGTQISGDYETGTSYTTAAQADGSINFAVRAVDAAGNASATSPVQAVTIDTVAPASPVAPDLQSGSDSGVLQTDNITNDGTPTLDVVAAPFYRLLQDATQVSTDYATATTFTTGTLGDGPHAFVLRAVDAAGNVSADSATLGVTIDTAAPAAPGAPDLQAGSDSGVSSTDNITNDSTPTIDITSTDTFYRLERGGTQVSGDYATGAFTSAAQGDGAYTFATRAVDAAGNVSAAGAGLGVTIDTVGLSAPTKQFFFETSHSMQFAFGEDVAATLANGDLVVQNLTGGGVVTTSLSYSNPTATFTFSGAPGGILPDGNFRATIAAAGVTDVAGNSLPADAVLDFFVFAGDANRDRAVNLDDFTVLAANFGLTGRVFSQGNFNYSLDGDVSLDDFTILAAQFGKTLPAAGDVPRNASVSDIARAPLRSRTSPFTTTRILDEVLDV